MFGLSSEPESVFAMRSLEVSRNASAVVAASLVDDDKAFIGFLISVGDSCGETLRGPTCGVRERTNGIGWAEDSET